MRKLSAIAIAVILSGCSSVTPLTGLIGSKPEITAQAGSENVKQTIGLTAKQDASSKQDTIIKESKVDTVDTSNKKEIKTSTIQANTIKADKIQVVQGNNGRWYDPVIICVVVLLVLICLYWREKKKEA